MKSVKKNITLKEKMTYAYIRKIKKSMFCPNCQEGKMSINKASTLWKCESCGYELDADEFVDDYVFWFCDECESYLNIQPGFDRTATKHICTTCGYENDITFDNVKGICKDCGKLIPDSESILCADCKILRKEKAKENLKKIGEGLLIAGTIAGAVAREAQEDESSMEENSRWTDFSYADYAAGDKSIRCANCGNMDENTLFEESETIYCSKCCHRTRKDNGKDDLVECPYCHRMRDRTAMYCRWCNDSAWKSSTKKEFEEIDTILKDMGN